MKRRRLGEIIARYFLVVLECDGALNDWLTHMPQPLRDLIYSAGQLLEKWLGC